MSPPVERTNKQQGSVATWLLVAILALAGGVAFYYSFRADADGKLEIAGQLRRIGLVCVGFAILALAIRRLVLWMAG